MEEIKSIDYGTSYIFLIVDPDTMTMTKVNEEKKLPYNNIFL